MNEGTIASLNEVSTRIRELSTRMLSRNIADDVIAFREYISQPLAASLTMGTVSFSSQPTRELFRIILEASNNGVFDATSLVRLQVNATDHDSPTVLRILVDLKERFHFDPWETGADVLTPSERKGFVVRLSRLADCFDNLEKLMMQTRSTNTILGDRLVLGPGLKVCYGGESIEVTNQEIRILEKFGDNDLLSVHALMNSKQDSIWRESYKSGGARERNAQREKMRVAFQRLRQKMFDVFGVEIKLQKDDVILCYPPNQIVQK